MTSSSLERVTITRGGRTCSNLVKVNRAGYEMLDEV